MSSLERCPDLRGSTFHVKIYVFCELEKVKLLDSV